MAKYDSRINAKISNEDKLKLEEIKKENPDISIRVIIEEFLKDYCSTNPKGIKLKIKELEYKLLEIQEERSLLDEKETKLNIQLKTYKDSLNKTLDNYIDTDLIKATNSISDLCKQQGFTSFEEIPEISFINIAKHNKIKVESLKEEVNKLF